MKIDIRGRIENTPLKPYRALLPVFEAISNARQSIANSERQHRGTITVRLERRGDDLLGGAASPIYSISIEDDGSGFTTQNFAAFDESDSRHKRAVGGKGIGRFFALKAFDHVQIESVYREADTWRKRSFLFTYSQDGIEKLHLEEVGERGFRTIVRLVEPKPKFAEQLPRTASTLAFKIAEHFLPILFDPACPRIRVFDGDDSANVNDIFSHSFAGQSIVEDFHVGAEAFTIRHIFNYGSAETPGHFIHYFAQDRGVFRESITKLIPGMPRSTRIVEGDRSFFYVGLVAGALLDQTVDFDRKNFDVPQEEEEVTLDNQVVTLGGIRASVADAVRVYLTPYVAPIQEAKLDRVRRLAIDQPQNHYLLKYYREEIEKISPDVTDDAALDAELRKIEFNARLGLNAKFESIKHKSVRSIEDIPAFRDEYLRFMEEHRELGQAKLAEYVSLRRVVLDLFSKFLSQRSDGRFELEEVLHAIICPRRATSADAIFSSHNLWLVDERLEYHAFLASDKELNRIDELENEHAQRPDVLLFNYPMAFADNYPYSSAVILEFKKPQRDNYTRADNPVAQIEGYVKLLKQGKVRGEGNRFINFPDIPVYGYAICDRTPTLVDVAEMTMGWTPTPDGTGYYGYNDKLKLYWELMEYEKMLDNAKKRNRVLFERLGLPTR